MDRRSFTRCLIAGAASLALPRGLLARLRCSPFNYAGVQRCEAGLDSTLAGSSAATQHRSQWCWAACIAMVFRYYRHPVSQERIVSDTWGTIVNLPGSPDQIVSDLNRDWTDDEGEDFHVEADVVSATPVTAAQDLADDMPLIIGTGGHAVVLTALTYDRDAYSRGNALAAIVRDPWPGRGRRVLTPQEWYSIAFAARIRVT